MGDLLSHVEYSFHAAFSNHATIHYISDHLVTLNIYSLSLQQLKGRTQFGGIHSRYSFVHRFESIVLHLSLTLSLSYTWVLLALNMWWIVDWIEMAVRIAFSTRFNCCLGSLLWLSRSSVHPFIRFFLFGRSFFRSFVRSYTTTIMMIISSSRDIVMHLGPWRVLSRSDGGSENESNS